MAIVHWPDDITPLQTITCSICGQEADTQEASAGMRDAQGRQAFACSTHFKERTLILGWTDYAILQNAQPNGDEFTNNSGQADECVLY